MREQDLLYIKPDYQRGSVWNPHQMRMLADSVMRGYSMPLVYLRHSDGKDRFEIIDGQQRIDALRSFMTGMYSEVKYEGRRLIRHHKPIGSLYNPVDDGGKMKLPQSLQTECSWSEKTFNDFSEHEKEMFLRRQIPLCIIECEDDVAHDLFIRLQGGRPLKPQEVRDAWPGNFCDLILQTGGKPELGFGSPMGQNKYEGHNFFRDLMNARPENDRGKTRKLAAQMLMLFLSRKEHGIDSFVSVNVEAIDSFYGQRVGMDMESPVVEEFRRILGVLRDAFNGSHHQLGVRSYEPLHLVLLADMLSDDFSSDWEGGIGDAHNAFLAAIERVKQFPTPEDTENKNFREIWEYSRMTRQQVDVEPTIKERHVFYVRQMLRLLGKSVQANPDPNAPGFREAVYYRGNTLCKDCRHHVAWQDARVVYSENYDKEMTCPNLRNHALAHIKCPDLPDAPTAD